MCQKCKLPVYVKNAIRFSQNYNFKMTGIIGYLIIDTCRDKTRLTQRLKNSEDYTSTQLRILHLTDLVNSL